MRTLSFVLILVVGCSTKIENQIQGVLENRLAASDIIDPEDRLLSVEILESKLVSDIIYCSGTARWESAGAQIQDVFRAEIAQTPTGLRVTKITLAGAEEATRLLAEAVDALRSGPGDTLP